MLTIYRIRLLIRRISERSGTRCTFLTGAVGSGILGLSGCRRMIGGGAESNELKEASFRFEHNGERLSIVYESVGSLVARQLWVRNRSGTR